MTKDELKQLENDLWSAADNLRANSDLRSSEYSTPVLGLIFLKFADNNYRLHEADTIPNDLLKNFSNIPADTNGDLFGQIYEYFLAEFARSEGQKGGEFFTPRSVVRVMVEMIEPHGGKVFDPACGSGGMFVQSVHFIEHLRKERKQADTGVFVYGQEKTLETVNLAKMNLAVTVCAAKSRKPTLTMKMLLG